MTPEQEAYARKSGFFGSSGIKGVGSTFANPTKVTPPSASDAAIANNVYAEKEKAAINANNTAFQQKEFGRQLSPTEQAAMDRQGLKTASTDGEVKPEAKSPTAAGWRNAAGMMASGMAQEDKAQAEQTLDALPTLGGPKGAFTQISKFGYRR